MQLLTVRQAAQEMQVSEYTIREWLKDGKIPGRKVGRAWRIPREELLKVVTG